MKTNHLPKMEDKPLLEAEVEAWLLAHPDFFIHHSECLEALKIPHECGDAVSLITRQVQVLQDKNRKLQNQMEGILRIARENDSLLRRFHQLTLAMLNAESLDDALGSLRWLLEDCFQADFVTVRLIHPVLECPITNLCVSEDCPELDHFKQVLDSGQPECGRPTREQSVFLFGEEAGDVESYALVPLQHVALNGILAIGSSDPQRFRSDMGNLFLSQMSDVVATRFAALLPKNQES